MKELERKKTTTRMRSVSIIEDVFDETPDPNEYGLEEFPNDDAIYIMNLTTGKKIARVVYKKKEETTREVESEIVDEMLGKLEQIIETLKK